MTVNSGRIVLPKAAIIGTLLIVFRKLKRFFSPNPNLEKRRFNYCRFSICRGKIKKRIDKMNIVYLRLEDLQPYEKNPRHNKESVKYVAESIKEFGFKVPIIIDRNYVIVAGHTRYKAAKKLKMEEVPCIIADDLTPDQVKAFRLADNKVGEFSEWDMDLLMEELQGIDMSMDVFGFEEFGVGDGDDVEVEEDFYEEELPKDPKVKRGEIYKLGDHTLMCGDSTKEDDVRRLTDDVEMDLCVTDPPYNVALGWHMRPSEAKQLHRRTDGLVIDNDDMNEEDFINFLKQAFANLLQALKPGGVFYIWYADTRSLEFRMAAVESGMQMRENLIWVKSTFAMGRQDYHWRHEPCLYGWKEGAAHYYIDDRTQSTVFEDCPDIDKMSKEQMRELLKKIFEEDGISTTILHEAKPSVSELHPTMKPLKLIGRLIKNSSKKGQNVLDLFGGSGSTLIACEQLGRKCYMMEYDPKYAETIIQRWETFTGEKAVKLRG